MERISRIRNIMLVKASSCTNSCSTTFTSNRDYQYDRIGYLYDPGNPLHLQKRDAETILDLRKSVPNRVETNARGSTVGVLAVEDAFNLEVIAVIAEK